jgi:hypothetical protein
VGTTRAPVFPNSPIFTLRHLTFENSSLHAMRLCVLPAEREPARKPCYSAESADKTETGSYKGVEVFLVYINSLEINTVPYLEKQHFKTKVRAQVMISPVQLG